MYSDTFYRNVIPCGMSRQLAFVIAATAGLLTHGVSAQQISPPDLRQQIETTVRSWVTAFRAGDAKAAAPYFTSPSVAITSLFEIVRSDPTERLAKDATVFRDFDVNVQDVGALGSDGAWATGTFTNVVHRPDGTMANVEGYVLEVFQRDGGTWKVVATSYTTKSPPR